MLADADRWRAWDRFLESTPATGFMQCSAWAQLRTLFGYEHFLVAVRDGERIVGGALVGKWTWAPGRCFYYIQDGPVLPSGDADAQAVFEQLRASIERHRAADPDRVSHLRIEPRWERLPDCVRGFAPLEFKDPFTEPRHTLCVDLRPSEAEILAQMKPKGRYNIRVAQRHGVTVAEADPADFQRIYRRTALRQGMERKPPPYFRELLARFAPRSQARVYVASGRGRALAAALVVHFGARATYFFGGSLAVHRDMMAPYLLHHEIMRAAKARGAECYDFWGIAPHGAPDHPWAGITEFKKKFGGREVRLVPTLDHVYDAATYAAYAAKRDPRRRRRAERPHAEGPRAP